MSKLPSGGFIQDPATINVNRKLQLLLSPPLPPSPSTIGRQMLEEDISRHLCLLRLAPLPCYFTLTGDRGLIHLASWPRGLEICSWAKF